MGVVTLTTRLNGTTSGEASLCLLPQMLSFDVALVAVGWQVMFSRSFHVPLPWPVLVITFCAVWIIYIADHVLDFHRIEALSPRHLFVRHHQRVLVAICVAVVIICSAFLKWMPRPIVISGACLAAAVGFYLALVHLATQRGRRTWPKEIIVGVMFAMGSTISTWSRARGDVVLFAGLALFATLCILNCAALEAEEWRGQPIGTKVPHASTVWIGKYFSSLTVLLLIAVVAFTWRTAETRLGIALGLATPLQIAAIRFPPSRSADLMRAMADASLLTPLLLLWK